MATMPPVHTDPDDAYQDIDPTRARLKEVLIYIHAAIHQGARATAVRFFDAMLQRSSSASRADDVNDVWITALRYGNPEMARHVLPHLTHPVENWVKEAVGHPALLVEMLDACPHTVSEVTAALVACLRAEGMKPPGNEHAVSFARLRFHGGDPSVALATALRSHGVVPAGPMPPETAELAFVFDRAMDWMTPEELEPHRALFETWTWLSPGQRAALLRHSLPPSSAPDRRPGGPRL